MKTNLAIAAVALACLAAPARADMVAGWDFSQYVGDGLLSIDGETLTATLSANYSDFDPTFGAGAQSAQYGTMYLNGQFGSTQTPLDLENDPIVPSAAAGGSLASNLDWPVDGVPDPDVPFDTCNVLLVEGQQYCNLLTVVALTVQSAASVVFEADLKELPQAGESWFVTFGGKTSAGTSNLSIDFSADGATYGPAETIMLDTTDTPYAVDFGPATSQKGYVRFNFSPVGVNQPFIDNVAINVPEPVGCGALAALSLAALRAARQRRTD